MLVRFGDSDIPISNIHRVRKTFINGETQEYEIMLSSSWVLPISSFTITNKEAPSYEEFMVLYEKAWGRIWPDTKPGTKDDLEEALGNNVRNQDPKFNPDGY